MKVKTEISKLTVDMNLGRITIGNYLIRLRNLARKHGSAFSDEFLDAVEKEGIRLKDLPVQTKAGQKRIEKAFDDFLNEPFGGSPQKKANDALNPPQGSKNDE